MSMLLNRCSHVINSTCSVTPLKANFLQPAQHLHKKELIL